MAGYKTFEDLVNAAEIPANFVSNNTNYNMYAQSARQLFQQGLSYHEAGNNVLAFVYYQKFCNFMLLELPKHKAHKANKTAPQVKKLMQMCGGALDVLESLKPRVKKELELIHADNVPVVNHVETVESEDTAWRTLGVSDDVIQSQKHALDEYSIEEQLKSVQITQKPAKVVPDMRSIWVPQSSIVNSFVSLAAVNTSLGLELCGLLTGILEHGVFKITHLIIPMQDCTPDSCELSDDATVFEYQNGHSLWSLGWIHTHPSQTCFLSSVDIHTQFGWQSMLGEAVSIVVSLRGMQSVGTFNLTEVGMIEVQNCTQLSTQHHVHGEGVYKAADHVVHMDGEVVVVDLRK